VETIVLSLANVQDTFWASFAGPLAGFLGGFATAILAEPIRQRLFRAKLKLEFESDQSSRLSSPFLARAHSDDFAGEQDKYHVQFIRVRVRNIEQYLARSCRAFLVDIEKQNEQGVFEQTHYYDSIQLKWASETQYPWHEIDLPYGVNKYIDVIETRSDSNSFYPCTEFLSSRLGEELLTQPGTFRLTILVTGDALDPQAAKLIFWWGGEWTTFAVHKE